MTQTEVLFKNQLKMFRSVMSKAEQERTKRIRKINPYPISIERAYARAIKNSIEGLVKQSEDKILPFISKWIPDTRVDSVDSDLDSIMRDLDTYIEQYYGTSFITSNLGMVLQDILERMFDKNSKYLEAQIKIVAGIPFAIEKPWWDSVKSLWEQENIALIKNLNKEYITKLNSTIITGIQSGWTEEELVDAIKVLSDKITGPRARLIARDQIGKLNGAITRAQFTDLGMKTYYWITAGDEKVRGNPVGQYPKAIPSHYIMNGLLFSWDNPSVYYNDTTQKWETKTDKMEMTHPGFAIACRCTAAPSWRDFIDNNLQ